QGLFDGPQALRECGLILENVQANVTTFLVGMARKTVLGEEWLHGPLILAPSGRRVCIGALAAAAGRQAQDEKRPEEGPGHCKSRPEIGWPHGRPRRRTASRRQVHRTTRPGSKSAKTTTRLRWGRSL